MSIFKRAFGRIQCLFGRHHRSQGRAGQVGDVYFSVCRYCGVRMRQRGSKDWIVDES
jgi:hypothetical protein